jgi:1,2-dihydroxy-3-keto-5-methylthiopentene dioxygenase
MPTITRPDGSVVAQAAEAKRLVRSLGLGVAKVAPAASPALGRVLAGRRLTDEDSRQILAANQNLLPRNYAGADVIALFPDSPGLSDLAFHRCHTHSDDEVRFILAGEGVFGFVLPDGGQVEITAEAGDLLSVPAGTEHWFRLGPRRTVVAVRLFGANPDWRAEYTGTTIEFPKE